MKACMCAPGSLQVSSHFPILVSIAFVSGERRHTCVTGRVDPTVEVENAVALASAHEDAKGHVWKVTLLEGMLVEARRT
jgi:hypothetical protein